MSDSDNVVEATDEDVMQFSAFVSVSGGQPYYKSVYGQYTYATLIENSLLMLKAFTGTGVSEFAKGFVAVSNSPANEALVDDIITAHLSKLPGVNEMNTVLLTFIALENQSESENKHGSDLLFGVFRAMLDLEYVFAVLPAKSRPHAFILEAFKEVHVIDDDYFNDKKVLCLTRAAILPRLVVRKARVEDNDDLLPVMRSSAARHMGDGDDFFLANLIQNQNETNRILVGLDKRNTPVGMLCTTREVDYAKLGKVYDLNKYPAFNAKLKATETKPKPVLILIVGEISPVGSDVLRQGALTLGFLYFDAQEIEAENRAAGNDEDYLLGVFRHRLDKLLAPISGQAPKGCVIGGYPLHVAQAHALRVSDLFFDYVLEMSALRDAASEDFLVLEEGLQEHLDAVKTLQEEHEDNIFMRSTWLHFVFDPSEMRSAIAERLLTDLLRALSSRDKKLRDSNAGAKLRVFAATLFCISKESASRSDDLIRAAFTDNPAFDFFFYVQPNEAPISPLTASMTVVPLKPDMTADQSLFVMHRDAIASKEEFRVLRYTSDMKTALDLFLSGQRDTPPPPAILLGGAMAAERMSLKENPMEVCFVALVRDVLVGFVSLSRKNMSTEDLVTLRKSFAIDRVIDFNRHRTKSQAFIQFLLMSPAHESRCSFFLTEVMAQFGKSLLYFLDHPQKGTSEFVLQTLIPVRPRLWCGEGAADHKRVDKSAGSTLYLTTKHLVHRRKTIAETKVVIVGGSANALSMLESFVYSPSVYMTNITIVSDVVPHGLHPHYIKENPDVKYKSGFTGALSTRNHQYLSDEEFTALGIYRRVKAKVGRLTDIDRSSRAIIVSDKSVVDYDVLVLAVGVQDVSYHGIASLKGSHPLVLADKGVFSLGGVVVDDLAMQWVKGESASGGVLDAAISSNIIVFGSGAEALHVVATLINLKVDPASIVWVWRTKSDLGSNEINAAIDLSVKSISVTQHAGYEIVDVMFDARTFVKGASIRPVGSKDSAAIVIPCCAILLSDRMSCDIEMFSAVNDSGLIFDGGLVVNHQFCTNDPHIYGVGDFTRFSRRYKNAQSHSLCNHSELGEYVAASILQRVTGSLFDESDASSAGAANSQVARSRPVLPLFKKPRTSSSLIPGGLRFVSSSVPIDRNNTSSMTTSNNEQKSTCTVKVDSLGNIVEFLYVGVQDIDCRSISRLVGRHESYANSATVNYELGQVQDWVAFLTAPWADLLHYDCFDLLVSSTRMRFEASPAMDSLVKILDEALSCTEDDLLVTGARRRYLGDRGDNLDATSKQTIESSLTEFVRDQKEFFPRFAVPKHNSSSHNERE